MSDELNVGIADMKIAYSPKGLISYALGSCVGICIVDQVKKVAGMVHIMLPTNNNVSDKNNVFKYADTGIPEMVKQMELMGCMRSRMIAKIAGGARMFEIKGNSSIGNIGERNTIATKEVLSKLNIKLIAQDVGANYGRTIIFDSDTGNLTIKSFAKNIKII
ncbi:chemotaxis protein CheD [Sedimentibacter acidaminivorans]|uniref:Probable chemoreceptor glutamine deamidase CheD n=1 Tax=Sedimentibacter acidaminivorans TaxID=913099 RepID=A0ABS4GDF9_9FIRM|nr:chemotaxis protein CheD [Sedimentibacter acidaminivorans]MBP1925728.1 chemotaxis protein CheD [Sedimentibacter acidaminivorans]